VVSTAPLLHYPGENIQEGTTADAMHDELFHLPLLYPGETVQVHRVAITVDDW